MADNAKQTIVTGPAVPLTITVSRDSGHWVVRAFYHGHTIGEALNPVMVAERYLSKAEVPLEARWVDLWRNVAVAVEDLSTGAGGIVRCD